MEALSFRRSMRCSTPGCGKPSWNGKSGQLCSPRCTNTDRIAAEHVAIAAPEPVREVHDECYVCESRRPMSKLTECDVCDYNACEDTCILRRNVRDINRVTCARCADRDSDFEEDEDATGPQDVRV